MFHSKCIQYSTWCQNRGCSYISSRRRIYRLNPAISCISPSILNISTVELQFYYNFQGWRKTAISAKCHWIQGLQSSSTRQNLHSKQQQGSPGSPCAVQVPRVQFPMLPSISTQQKFHSMQPEMIQQVPVEFPCCSRRGILIIFHRISTCNTHSSTKVSGFKNLLSILCLQEFLRNFILPLVIILPSVQN